MVDLEIKQRLQQAVLRRWAGSPHSDTMVLRGGVLIRHWIGDCRRADDVDFLARYPFDPERTIEDARSALGACHRDGISFKIPDLKAEIIFAETDFPGVRMTVLARVDDLQAPSRTATHQVQIDVGYGDPMPGGSQSIEMQNALEPIVLSAPRPEVAFAWKVHGLVERHDHTWRPKDLADLWLIAKWMELEGQLLQEAMRVAFDSRDAPFWRVDRLMNRRFGSSRRSRRAWARWIRQNPQAGAEEELSRVVEEVARVIDPHWEYLRGDHDPVRWPQEPHLDETLAAVANDPDFVVYEMPGGNTTIVYEQQTATTFPDPLKAATRAEFRRRQLRRECRGITFDSHGQVISRPLPKFFNLINTDQAKNALALEKLDGSLVFPTPQLPKWIWRTRRGPSDIADQAGRFARSSSGDYDGFVDWCLERCLTPLFEWCSRSRRIVFDHPADRLVLIAVRRNACGELLPRHELEQLAKRFHVELVRSLGTVAAPAALQHEVSQWTDREGCVLVHENQKYDAARPSSESLFKLKATRYVLLHRAVEGPSRDRARWTLLLSGAERTLCETSAAREVPLEDYVRSFVAALDATTDDVLSHISPLADRSPVARRQLATDVAGLPGFLRHVAFSAFDGFDARQHLSAILLSCCQNETRFRRVAQQIGGPLLNDG